MFNQQRKGEIKMKKNNEFGRSMVEMLGVLAIIGVLSVGGIAGYTTAMNSHRANEAVNNATRLAMLLSSKRLLDPNATLTDELTGTGFQISDAKDKIELSVSVPDSVKSRIEGMGLTTATLDTTTPGKITFTFENDLSEEDTSDNQELTNPCTGKADYTSCEDDKICFSEHCQVDCRGPSHETGPDAIYYFPNCPEHCVKMSGGLNGCHNSEAEARIRCGILPWERIDDRHFVCD